MSNLFTNTQITKTQIKNRKKQCTDKVCRCMIRLLFSFSMGTAAALILVPTAYMERGYYAIGGEWVGSIFVVFVTFQFTKTFFKENRNE